MLYQLASIEYGAIYVAYVAAVSNPVELGAAASELLLQAAVTLGAHGDDLGLALENLQDYDGAIAELGRAFELEPSDDRKRALALCHYNKGRALSFLGQTLEAAECFYKAQALNVNSQELDNQDIEDRLKQLFESTE